MSRRLVPHPSVVARRLDANVVLVHLDTNRMFTLNRTGSLIWELLVAGESEEDIEQSLLGRFSVDPEELRTELAELVDLLRRELLVIEAEDER